MCETGGANYANAARRLAPSSFFGQFFTGAFGGLAPISISVGISYFARLVGEKHVQFVDAERRILRPRNAFADWPLGIGNALSASAF